MQSLSFKPGSAVLASDSPVSPWSVLFEDEGLAGYFYACDRTRPTQDQSILDAMLIYNVGALKEPEAERIASIEWSRDGLQAVLYLDGTAQALCDFESRQGYCRMDFPNFLAGQNDTWRRHTHAWSDAALQRFEASLYA